MAELVTLQIDGREVRASAGSILAAALAEQGRFAMRRSVTGEARAPLCGMGICFECRATVDGLPQVRTCAVIVKDGMEVRTDG